MRARWWVLGGLGAFLLAAAGSWLAWGWLARRTAEPAMAGGIVGRRLPSLHGVAWAVGAEPEARELLEHPVVVVAWEEASPSGRRAAEAARVWDERYRELGLRVILVHSPAYDFQTVSHVAESCGKLGLRLPVAQDEDRVLRRRLDLARIPAAVVADASGVVRLARGGDPLDAYAVERSLRAALAASLGAGALPASCFPAAEEPAMESATPEVSLGTTRGVQPEGSPLVASLTDETHAFAPVFDFQLERADGVPVPVGLWRTRPDALQSARGSAADYLALRYHGRDVWVVAAADSAGPARIWVLQDDAWLPAEALGPDAARDNRGASAVVLQTPGVYHVARNPSPGSHVLKLQPDRPGVRLYAVIVEPFPAAGADRR